MTTLRYAAYARSATGKGTSLDEQLHLIHQWAAKQSVHFELVGDFQEVYSGVEYRRPQMDIVRTLAQQGAIDAVVVSRTNRLARDIAALIVLEQHFKRCGVRLFSVEDGALSGAAHQFLSALEMLWRLE